MWRLPRRSSTTLIAPEQVHRVHQAVASVVHLPGAGLGDAPPDMGLHELQGEGRRLLAREHRQTRRRPSPTARTSSSTGRGSTGSSSGAQSAGGDCRQGAVRPGHVAQQRLGPARRLHRRREERRSSRWSTSRRAIDQTRGWAYTLLVLNVIYQQRAVAPYRAFLFQGHVLDEKGRKMSKSLGNVLDALEMLNNGSVDLLRYYIIWKSSPGRRRSASTPRR